MATYEGKSMDKMKKAELQAIAEKFELSTEGTNKELIERIESVVTEKLDAEEPVAENAVEQPISTTVEENFPVLVEVESTYHDKEFNRIFQKGTQVEMTAERVKLLTSKGLVKQIESSKEVAKA